MSHAILHLDFITYSNTSTYTSTHSSCEAVGLNGILPPGSGCFSLGGTPLAFPNSAALQDFMLSVRVSLQA